MSVFLNNHKKIESLRNSGNSISKRDTEIKVDKSTEFKDVEIMDESNVFVTVFLAVVLLGSTAAVLYWAATIENDIENNPGN